MQNASALAKTLQAAKSGAYLIAQLALLLFLIDSAAAFAESEPRPLEIRLGQVSQIQARNCVVALDIRVLNAPKGAFSVALASPAQYEAADATFPHWLAGAVIETRQIQGRTDRIHLCSMHPADNPLLELILRLKATTGVVHKNVMLVIDPLPVSRADLPVEASSPAQVQPVVQAHPLPDAGNLTEKKLVKKTKKPGPAQTSQAAAAEPVASPPVAPVEPVPETAAPVALVPAESTESTPLAAPLPAPQVGQPGATPWWQIWLDLALLNTSQILLGVAGLLLALVCWLLGRRFIPRLGRFRLGAQRDGIVRDFSLFGPGSRPPKGGPSKI